MSRMDDKPNDAVSDRPRANMSLLGRVGVAVVLIAAAVGAFAILSNSPQGQQHSQLPSRFQLDISSHLEIPAQLFSFEQLSTYKLQLGKPSTIAIGPDDSIYIGGDRSIEILGADGNHVNSIVLAGKPTCITIAGKEASEPGRLFVGMEGHVVVFDASGTRIATWGTGNANALLTGLTVAGDELFVADAGNRVVRRYNAQGALVNDIGASSPDRDLSGFVVPSAYFDLVVGPDELLYVVNPGMRRVESYTFDGQLQSFWGVTGSSLPEFFGCCNPAQLAIFPDGRFITSEKGIPRVKIYSAVGDFESVVAGPRELGLRAEDLGDARGEEHQPVFDIAVDRRGRILVLDRRNRCIRLFSPLKSLQSRPESPKDEATS